MIIFTDPETRPLSGSLHPAKRDMGLDIIRALALILMTSIHYARPIPDVNQWIVALKFIGEAAPAFFFFAFGMTMERFLSKDDTARLTRLNAFLYVALMHNIFVAQVYVTGFLFILWVIQAALYALEKSTHRPGRYYVAIFALTSAALMVFPPARVSGFFAMLIPGNFPILPWSLFVISGLVFTRIRRRLQSLQTILPVFLILVAVAGHFVAYQRFGMEAMRIEKWPLTLSYLLLFAGVNILLLKSGEKFQHWIQSRLPDFHRLILFLSGNLLLAVILSYLPCSPLMALNKMLFAEQTIIDNALSFLVIGSVLCVLLLLLFLKLTLVVWEFIRQLRFTMTLRRRFDMLAIVLIVVFALATGIVRYAIEGPGSYFFTWESIVKPHQVRNAYDPILAVCLILLIYFGLEMTERRNTTPAASGISPKKQIGIILFLFVFAVCANMTPLLLEKYVLMRTREPDAVPQRLQEIIVTSFARKHVYISHLKPEPKIVISPNATVYPYRCIIKRQGASLKPLDAIFFFVMASPPGFAVQTFRNANFVSYKSYGADLRKGGRTYLRDELIEMFPELKAL